MPLRTPTNQLTDKEIHIQVELWKDIVCYIPNFYGRKQKEVYKQ